MLKSYLKDIYEIANRGDAREESYCSVLALLLQKYAGSVDRKDASERYSKQEILGFSGTV